MQDVAHVEAAAATGPRTLAVTWRDGSVSHVDLAGWIARGGRRFAALGNALVFAGVKVGLYGGNVTWDDDEGDLAIDSEHLRLLAEYQAPFDAAAAARWQAEVGVSNVEAADLLDIAPSTWASYKAGAPIPGVVARLCRVMRDDPAMLSAHLRPRTAGNPGKGPIYVDAAHSAELRSNGTTRSFSYLHDAVIAFYGLPDAEQSHASIEVIEEGTVYRLPAIRRLHDLPEGDQPAPDR